MVLADPPVDPGQSDFSQILVNIGVDPVIAVIVSCGVFVVALGFAAWAVAYVAGFFRDGSKPSQWGNH